MLAHQLGLRPTPLNQFVVLVLAGLTIYLALSSVSYLVVFVLGRKRFHPSYVPDGAANRNAVKWGVIGTLGNVVLMTPFHLLIAGGHSRIYWDVRAYGVPWLLASAVIYVGLIDTAIYWVHRAMHGEFLYRRLHRYHHQWRVPTSWVSMAFHPLDSFAQAVPVHLIGFVIPLNGWLYLGVASFMSLWSVSVHDRVSVVHWKWLNYTDHHTLHHWLYRCNYGQFFTFWDRAMGTWRDPAVEARSSRIPDGVLR